MKKADAPPPGWYPDPQGGTRLRWWDGLDWTEARRAPPNPAWDIDQVATGEGDAAPDRRGGSAMSSLQQASVPPSLRRAETQDMVAEARKVARAEVDRAVETFTQRASDASRRLEPLISQYGGDLIRWLRRAGIVAVVLLVLWMLLQTVGQVGLMEWLGDRIDNLVEGVVTVVTLLASGAS